MVVWQLLVPGEEGRTAPAAVPPRRATGGGAPAKVCRLIVRPLLLPLYPFDVRILLANVAIHQTINSTAVALVCAAGNKSGHYLAGIFIC